jgi:hypothetical protein
MIQMPTVALDYRASILGRDLCDVNNKFLGKQ